jgi:hypothetical protein
MKTRRAPAQRVPTIRYTFRDGPLPLKNAKEADPQTIGTALAEIAAASEGHLTPQATVAAARDPRNALHPHFEWDDSLAAESYRLDQARSLIRMIRIEDDAQENDPPAFLSVNEGKAGVSYRTYGDVLGSVTLQDAVLRAAERDLKAFEDRYRRLEDICEIVRSARERITERRASHTETRASA